jgi:hypothetical protein
VTGDARLESGRLRITFARQGDRYGHQVESIAADKSATPLLQSIEGTPDQDWPASPALKELHLEQRPDGKQLALLVGMAGRSHWSLSVELDPVAEQLVFDVACRLRDEPQQLTSAYRLLSQSGPLTIDSGRVLLPDGLELQPQAVEGQLADMALPMPLALVFHPPIRYGNYPKTVRWRYAIGLANLG